MTASQCQAEARQRAVLILQVQSGQLTAAAAARQLQLSRKSYYQWEQRGLQALLRAVEQRPPGRPRKRRSAEAEQWRIRAQELERQVQELQQIAQLRQQLLRLKGPHLPVKKNSRSWRPSSKASKPRGPQPG